MADYINPRAHACQNCVKAKAKCYGQIEGHCERCKRLEKTCTMQDRSVRRPKKTAKTAKHDQAGQIAQLEQKLNGLVSLLGTSPLPPTGREPSATTFKSIGIASSGTVSTVTHLDSGYPNGQILPITQGYQAMSSMTPDSESAAEYVSDPFFGTTNGKSPDELLGVFRRDMARQVPFIAISSQISAQALSRESPFLFRAIITVASYHDSVHQLQMGQELVKYLLEHLFILGEKNIDLLQGLLVYIHWYNNLFHTSPQINTLLGLAFSLLVDLNLYLPYKNFENHEKFVGEMKVAITCNPSWIRPTGPTMEEKRMVLGCFYLFSWVSFRFRDLNPIHWNTTVQQCHEEILKAAESESDVYLAHLADLQRIAEEIRCIINREFPLSKPTAKSSSVGLYLKLLTSQLQTFKVTLPESLQHDSLMLTQYHAIEMLAFDLSFFMPPTAPAHGQTLQRADALLMCLTSTRAFIDIYLSLSLEPHISFSSASVAQVFLAMSTLSKLILFDGKDWESIYAQPSMDLFNLLDRLVTALNERSSRYDLVETNKPWLQISRKLKQIKIRLNNLLSRENSLSASFPVEQSSNGSVATSLHSDDFDLLDDRFWQTWLDDPTIYS